jgi:hypothetical protein
MQSKIIIFLSTIICMQCSLHADSKDISIEEIFANAYLRQMCRSSNDSIKRALGKNLDQYPTEGATDRAYRAIDQLSIDDKCMLALFWGLSLPLDGEYAETFGKFLGKDRVAVAKRLKNISDYDLNELCISMQYRKEKASYMKSQINKWLDPKMNYLFE